MRVLKKHRIALANGARDGVPIGLGYFAVAFSLGIAARNAGLDAALTIEVSKKTTAKIGRQNFFTKIKNSFQKYFRKNFNKNFYVRQMNLH